jgi:hypothetical protein
VLHRVISYVVDRGVRGRGFSVDVDVEVVCLSGDELAQILYLGVVCMCWREF